MNPEPEQKTLQGPQARGHCNPEPAESVQVCKPEPMSILELEPEPMLAMSMKHKPEPTPDPEMKPAKTDQVCLLVLMFMPAGVLVDFDIMEWSSTLPHAPEVCTVPPHVNSSIP